MPFRKVNRLTPEERTGPKLSEFGFTTGVAEPKFEKFEHVEEVTKEPEKASGTLGSFNLPPEYEVKERPSISHYTNPFYRLDQGLKAKGFQKEHSRTLFRELAPGKIESWAGDFYIRRWDGHWAKAWIAPVGKLDQSGKPEGGKWSGYLIGSPELGWKVSTGWDTLEASIYKLLAGSIAKRETVKERNARLERNFLALNGAPGVARRHDIEMLEKTAGKLNLPGPQQGSKLDRAIEWWRSLTDEARWEYLKGVTWSGPNDQRVIRLLELYREHGPPETQAVPSTARELPAKPSKPFKIEKWVPHVGDEVVFAGQYATGMEFPLGVVHQRGYKVHGDKGIVVGWIGNQLVVRGGEEVRPDGSVSYSNEIPGRAYRDFWAPANEFYLIKHGTNIEPPHVEQPGPFASFGGGIKTADQFYNNVYRVDKGLPPLPKFDLEQFVKDNPYMGEPPKEDIERMRSKVQRMKRGGR